MEITVQAHLSPAMQAAWEKQLQDRKKGRFSVGGTSVPNPAKAKLAPEEHLGSMIPYSMVGTWQQKLLQEEAERNRVNQLREAERTRTRGTFSPLLRESDDRDTVARRTLAEERRIREAEYRRRARQFTAPPPPAAAERQDVEGLFKTASLKAHMAAGLFGEKTSASPAEQPPHFTGSQGQARPNGADISSGPGPKKIYLRKVS